MQRLIIHAGLHKTGTSSLQLMLSRMSSDLLKAGFVYPNEPAQINHHHVLAHCYFGKDLSYLESFLRFTEAIPGSSDIILSSEEFSTCFLDREFTNRFYDIYRHMFRIQVFVCLRRQDYLLESTFNQVVRDSDNRRIDRPTFYDFDFLKRAQILWEVFGKDSVTLLPYDHVDNVATTYRGLTGQSLVGACHGHPMSINRSLNRRAALALSLIGSQSRRENHILRRIIQDRDVIKDDGIKYISSPRHRRSFLSSYAKDNQTLSRRSGFGSIADLLRYEGPEPAWRPPAPISQQETMAIVRELAKEIDLLHPK